MSDRVLKPDELECTRVFEAPRELVFRCMIEPEHLTHFWGLAGVSAPLRHMRVDALVAGTFETIMVNDADASEYATHATYVERSPHRNVWCGERCTAAMTVTATFKAIGNMRTELHIHQTNVPELFRGVEAQAGFLTSLDRFET